MKTILFFFVICLVIVSIIFFVKKEDYNHEANTALFQNNSNKEFNEKFDGIEDRVKFEFDMLKDPATGKIPRNIREQEVRFAETQPSREELYDNFNTYTTLGPGNLGGRTRAFEYDILNPLIMLSGGVSSGMFRSIDGGASWTNVTPASEIHNVTALAQDRRAGFQTTWYYGTGEALGNTASLGSFYFGHGIYKSVDNGVSWAKLAATNSTLETFDTPFDLVHRIVVNPVNGHIYAACQRVIERSMDGGITWSIVLGTFGGTTFTGATDITCTSTGRLFASFNGSEETGMDGVWTSTTGNSGTWTHIAGTGSATTPAGWNAAGLYGRIVLAHAPSNVNILYVLYDNFVASNCAGVAAPEADFFRWDQSSTSWSDRSANMPNEAGCLNGNDPFAVQGGYDLVVAVKPDDENFVVIGGTNAYRSTNGFATAGATTRIGGYASPASYALYLGHHPDIHVFKFHPTTSTIMVCGSDGGIHRTASVAASPVVWTNLNNNYITYQYYHVALDPTIGSTIAIGGTQDNGTTRTTGTTTHTGIFGGDGVAVGISSGNTFHYVGFQLGNILRRLSTDLPGFGTNIKPTGSGFGIFVTYFLLDPDNTEVLYFADFGNLYRTASASTVTPATWTAMTGVNGATTGDIRSMATTRGPYTAGSKLYIGTSDAKIYRLNNPRDVSAATSPVNITGGAMPIGAVVSSIAVNPIDDKQIIVTFSNYGVSSIWFTSDASVAAPVWSAVEGNISLPSIRSSAIVNCTGSPIEFYVGTSVGLWGTIALSGAATVWEREGSSSIKLAVTSSLAYRSSDKGLLIGTHGNGMFRTIIDCTLPVELASFSANVNTNNVTLNWTTNSELNNSGFDIERKLPDNSEWKKLGNIAGNGTTNESHSYSFTDKNLNSGVYNYRLKQIDYNGSYQYHNLSNEVMVGIPNKFELSQNYPNPFNPVTKIDFALPYDGKISLVVFDMAGREIQRLVNNTQTSGYYSVKFDGTNFSSGVYFYRIEVSGQNNFVDTKKMLLVK